jgi:hypothetical protein
VNKRLSILAGVVLITVGVMAMGCNVAALLLGVDGWGWEVWRLWPLAVVCSGLLFVVPPLLVRGKRGLGALFIPGVPILTTGSILLFASVFDAWRAWAWLWPLEVLAVAAGLLLAGIYMVGALWLLVPATIIGANGLLLQFCAITGWWGVWRVLWRLNPLWRLAEVVGPVLLILAGFLLLAGGAARRTPAPDPAAE